MSTAREIVQEAVRARKSDQVRAELAALAELIRAQAELITCYRVRAGRRQTERALGAVDRARAKLRGMGVDIDDP